MRRAASTVGEPIARSAGCGGAEAIDEAKATRASSRERGLAFAHEFGLLGPDALLSHSTNLTEEIAICGETGTCIVHNPNAIASILGCWPAPELIEAGATVCLGSDATAPDRSADMFRHMQQCMHSHRTYFRDPAWLAPGKVLEMCTIDGAKALGLEREIGSLQAGKKADLILVDLRRPHLDPANMPAFRVVYFANGNDVSTVVVDGQVRLEDREAVGLDENRVLDDAQAETERMLDRLGLRYLTAMPETFWDLRATNQVR